MVWCIFRFSVHVATWHFGYAKMMTSAVSKPLKLIPYLRFLFVCVFIAINQSNQIIMFYYRLQTSMLFPFYDYRSFASFSSPFSLEGRCEMRHNWTYESHNTYTNNWCLSASHFLMYYDCCWQAHYVVCLQNYFNVNTFCFAEHVMFDSIS